MKLRTPGCSEATLLTWYAACHVSHGTVPAAGAAGSCAATPSEHAAPSSAAAIRADLFMEPDSVGHGLDAIPARVPGHQQEEGKIAYGKNPRRVDVGDGDRLESQPHQRAEGDGEDRQEATEPPAAVADRADRRAVQPRQEEKRHHSDQQQQRTQALVW